MNLITWIFYVIGRVLTIPQGSIQEMRLAEEQGNDWYKKIKETSIGQKVLEQWWFKVLLLVVGIIWIIPALRRKMAPPPPPVYAPNEGDEEVEYEIVD